MFRDEIYISPIYRLRDYNDIGLSIDSCQSDWELAVAIFIDRMEGRFIILIQDLIDKVRDQRYFDFSFSAMALSCLFIETLQQFKNGLDSTEWQKNEKSFVEFFCNSNFFKEYFTKTIATIFYRDIRCGILHQAQTKRNSQLTYSARIMVQRIDKGIIVDVEKFIGSLISEHEEYIDNIINPNNKYKHKLRLNFIEKMKFISMRNGDEKIYHSLLNKIKEF